MRVCVGRDFTRPFPASHGDIKLTERVISIWTDGLFFQIH